MDQAPGEMGFSCADRAMQQHDITGRKALAKRRGKCGGGIRGGQGEAARRHARRMPPVPAPRKMRSARIRLQHAVVLSGGLGQPVAEETDQRGAVLDRMRACRCGR